MRGNTPATVHIFIMAVAHGKESLWGGLFIRAEKDPSFHILWNLSAGQIDEGGSHVHRRYQFIRKCAGLEFGFVFFRHPNNQGHKDATLVKKSFTTEDGLAVVSHQHNDGVFIETLCF